jgi:parvulin-like peptidyl-prolyl isomerase
MNRFTLTFSLLAALSLTPIINGQKAAELTVATINGHQVSLEHYKDFLLTTVASGELARLIDTILIEQAASDYGITVSDAEISERVKSAWLDMLAGGTEEEFLRQYQPLGFSKELTLASMHANAVTQFQLEKYIVATRVITDKKLQDAFNSQYGYDGIKINVAHIMLTPHYIRANALKNNNEITYDQAKEIAKRQANECLAKLAAGASFSDMVIEYSHDTATKQNNGVLVVYRPGIYGEAFKNQVDTLDAQQTSKTVVESGAGFHVVRVNSRVVSRLNDVREQLSKSLLEAPANISERKNAIVDLRSSAKIEYPND